MRKKPTLSSIAREAGVSPATVSRYFSNSSYVGKEARQRISRVVNKHNYRPNFFAQSLVRGHTRNIGLLVTELDNPVTAEDIRGILTKCQEAGYTVFTAYTFEETSRQQATIQLMERIQPDGLIILTEPWEDDTQFITYLEELSRFRRLPVVVAGERQKNDTLDCVAYDSRETGRLATAHLIDRGFSPVGCVTGSLRTADGRLRYEGYRQALIQANIAHDPRYVFEGHFRREDGYHALQHFHRNDCLPRALVCCNDVTAFGVYLAAEELGIRIPHDVAVIGCDNVPGSSLIHPKLSTISFDNVENGKLLADMLISRIETPDLPQRVAHIRPMLIPRESTKP